MKHTKATPPGQPSKDVIVSKEFNLERRREESKNILKAKETQYIRDRQEAYPSIEEQLDMIYHKGVAKWKATIKKIKDENPKP
jgi:hypothetical protein